MNLQRIKFRLRHWGVIKSEDGRRSGAILGGLVICRDAMLPPRDESGYPVVEGAMLSLTMHTDKPGYPFRGGAGGFRLRIPPTADRRTPSIFVGLVGVRMWNSPHSRLTREGRTARRWARERQREHRERRIVGYEDDGMMTLTDFEAARPLAQFTQPPAS